MPILSDFPTAPDQTDLATFNARMRAWIAHHATFVAEANTLAAEVIASGTFANIVNTGGFSNNNALEDFDAITQTGFYRNTTTGCVGAPIAITNFLLFHQNIGVNAAAQMAIHAGGTGTYTRNKSAGVWSAWSDVVDSANIGRISATVAAGAWGDRATLRHGTANTAIVFGTSYAGSALRITGIGVQGAGVAVLSTGSATAPSGTWQARCDFPAQAGVFGGGEFLRVL
jgi:hypothetical protein